jgi:hypothetical protein
MSIKFIENAIFHTSELIPFDIAKLGKEVMMKWKPEKKYWITPGLVVAHRDNLTQKIYVEEIIRRSIAIENGELDEKTRKPITEHIDKIEGIRCHFWEESK